MADTQQQDAAAPVRSIFDEPPKKKSSAFIVALIVAILVHALLGFYLWKSKFEPKYQQYSDDVTDVAIINPVAPPPKLQPRPPVSAPDLPSTIPPLPVPPVEKRIEQPEPPRAPPPVPPRPSVITQPDWSRRPNSEDLARYYPDRASRLELEGSATISCSVRANGTLENCSVVSETPADAGFGEATLRASKLFKMRPTTRDGAPVDGGTVRIPLRWVLPK